MSSGFAQDDGFFQTGQYGQGAAQHQQQTGYTMSYEPADSSGFGNFDYSSGGQQQAPSTAYGQPYTGSILTPDSHAYNQPARTDEEDFENEPPLLEELGINFDHIIQKTLAVLNPLKQTEQDVVADADLAGPLVFCLAFGATLLLAGKVSFGYIYGLGVVGSLGMYSLLNLMSLTGVAITCVISVLGYCLLPMVLLSAAGIFISLKAVVLGTTLTGLTVLWCSFSASKLFVSALQMDQQQLLIAYPCALVYGVFALLTVF